MKLKTIILIFFMSFSCSKKDKELNQRTYQPRELNMYSLSLKNKKEELVIFEKCYKKFTRAPLDRGHPLVDKIQKKLISGAGACTELISNIQIDDGGTFIGDFPESIEIARNLHQFHNTWSSSFDLHTSNDNWGTFLVNDTEESALYFTKSLFHRDFKLRQTLTSEYSLEAIREARNESDYLFYRLNEELFPKNRFAYYTGVDRSKPRVWHPAPEEVQEGKLVGIRKIKKGRDILPYLTVGSDVLNDEEKVSIDLNKNFGGGFIGSSSYILLNYNLDKGQSTDAAINIHRRWSQKVIEDVLCRELPLLKKSDVTEHIVPDAKISYQKMSDCMQCHVSMDPMAGVLRNLYSGYNNDVADTIDLDNPQEIGYLQLRALNAHQVSKPHQDGEFFFGNTDPNYHQSPPEGRLIFRNIYGELVDVSVKNLQSLGEVLSDQDDFYACVAKRYFHFITGINVDLNHLNQEYAKSELKNQYIADLLMHLAKGLKSSQSLKMLIKEIVEHPLFVVPLEEFSVKLQQENTKN